jgi:hypothetical protein
MIHWPELLRDIEQWADGFLIGAAAASLIVHGAAGPILRTRNGPLPVQACAADGVGRK